jgi:hypothetical protein
MREYWNKGLTHTNPPLGDHVWYTVTMDTFRHHETGHDPAAIYLPQPDHYFSK